MTPKRRTRPRMMAPKEDAPIRCQSHLKWVRGFACSCSEIDPAGCDGKIEAAHVRRGTDGGIGSKPGDNWTLPLCSGHHAEQHRIGEQSFEKKYRLSMKQIAERLWRLSPHRLRHERSKLGMSALSDGSLGRRSMPRAEKDVEG